MSQPIKSLYPTRKFLSKLSWHILAGILIILFSLAIGMVGYHHYESMNWVDAYVNAAMILSGMGPVSTLQTDDGKIFAGTYALFSGIVFLAIIAFIFFPVFKRIFHKIHIEFYNKD